MGTRSNRLGDLCFGAQIRKIGIPLHTPVFFYIKVGVKGVYISRTCFSDAMCEKQYINIVKAMIKAFQRSSIKVISS